MHMGHVLQNCITSCAKSAKRPQEDVGDVMLVRSLSSGLNAPEVCLEVRLRGTAQPGCQRLALALQSSKVQRRAYSM